MVTTIPDPQLLRSAAEVVRANGLHRGGFVRRRPGWPVGACPVCVLGALNIADGSDPTVPTPAVQDARLWLEAEFRSVLGCGDIAFWNDEPGRTEADVIDLLTRAASAAESARAAAETGGGLPIDVMHASADGPGVQTYDRYDPDGDLDAGESL